MLQSILTRFGAQRGISSAERNSRWRATEG